MSGLKLPMLPLTRPYQTLRPVASSRLRMRNLAAVGLPLVLPALLDGLPHSLGVLLAVILVQIGCFDIRRGSSVGVVKKTAGYVSS